jgi:hypothetical protein
VLSAVHPSREVLWLVLDGLREDGGHLRHPRGHGRHDAASGDKLGWGHRLLKQLVLVKMMLVFIVVQLVMLLLLKVCNNVITRVL